MTKPVVMTIATNKGGAGKTTTAVHLAAGLARAGRRVLLVDLDKQGHCATFLGRDPAPRLYDLLVKERELAELIVEVRPNLHLLASNSETLVAQDFARLRNAQADLLEQALVRKAVGYDVLVFDTPPQGLLQECAIYSTDVVVVPVPVDYPGMDGAAQFVQVVRHIQEREKLPPLRMVFVPMFVDLRTSESKYNLHLLQKQFGQQVLAPVPVRTRMREAIADGKTIFEYAPGEDIAGLYDELCQVVMASPAPPSTTGRKLGKQPRQQADQDG
jgi:chromosome partitioning protein